MQQIKAILQWNFYLNYVLKFRKKCNLLQASSEIPTFKVPQIKFLSHFLTQKCLLNMAWQPWLSLAFKIGLNIQEKILSCFLKYNP